MNLARKGRRWAIVGGIALAFLLLIGYVVAGATAAGGPAARADRALATTLGHQDSVIATLSTDPFKNVDVRSSTPDIPRAKAALTDYVRRLAQSIALVASDRAALRRVQPSLAGSWLTVPEQSTLTHNRRRVAAGLAALDSAGSGLDLLQQESAFAGPFLDALAGFEALGSATDLASVQAQLPATGASLQLAVALAKPPAVPAELAPLLTAMQHAVSDLQAMVAAEATNDATTFHQASSSLDADVKALSGFDQATLDKASQARFQPLIDAYNANLKIAAGG
jgi:hypothetical protein